MFNRQTVTSVSINLSFACISFKLTSAWTAKSEKKVEDRYNGLTKEGKDFFSEQ